jgi:hypothetical protein
VHHELTAHRKSAQAQVEADRRAALKLHKELNVQGVQPGDKRVRDGPVDSGGDVRMNRAEGEHDAEEDDESQPWQVVGRKKGKGRACDPAVGQTLSSSSSGRSSAFSMGPLATAPRAAAGGDGRHGRDRSPRRPSASGTPATALESGALQRSGESEAREPIPPTPELVPQSGTVQQSEELEETPQMPTPAVQPTVEELETPYLDSLPSTPRAGASEAGEEETPCLSELPGSALPMEQDSGRAPTGSGPSN